MPQHFCLVFPTGFSAIQDAAGDLDLQVFRGKLFQGWQFESDVLRDGMVRSLAASC